MISNFLTFSTSLLLFPTTAPASPNEPRFLLGKTKHAKSPKVPQNLSSILLHVLQHPLLQTIYFFCNFANFFHSAGYRINEQEEYI